MDTIFKDCIQDGLLRSKTKRGDNTYNTIKKVRGKENGKCKKELGTRKGKIGK